MADKSYVSILDLTEAAAGNFGEGVGNAVVIKEMLAKLNNIDKNLEAWAKGGGGIPSQSNAKTFGKNSSNTFRDRQNNRLSFGGGRNQRKGFMDSFEDSLLEGFLGSGFKKDVGNIFKGFADRLGTDIKGIPDAVGKQLGQTAMAAFKSTTFGKNLTAKVDQAKNNFLTNLNMRGNQAITRMQQNAENPQALANRMNRQLEPLSQIQSNGQAIVQGGFQGLRGTGSLLRSGLSALKNAPGNIMSMFQAPQSNFTEMNLNDLESSVAGVPEVPEVDLASLEQQIAGPMAEASEAAAGAMEGMAGAGAGATEGLTSLIGAGGGATEALASLGPHGMAAAAALVAIEVVSGRVMEGLKSIGDGFKQIFKGLSDAANRDAKAREKNLEYAKQRMKADYETMVKAPFELLEKAATDLYNAWNQNLTTISATQGYTKSDVQDLMAAYAERIRDEGLSKYVSGSDLFNNLANVLKSGMSGAIAEEFAYQATLLNKAVPTQDFFQYASTYASVAANAVRDGKSQTEAINIANDSLNSFASSLLYTSRELTGGFTTGLQNASSLYADASKIALAAGSDNINAISSTMAAIQGYVGAVAPDLAESLTSTIYKLATGGNSAETVALRSLAGVNASNTEFLRALANNPQSTLATMFENLAAMYTQSPDAYMEKAEGYASLFGLDAQAFQRVDFNELAKSIREMNVNNDSLNENMELLLEGQTTTSTEQLKAQQINQYMIDEGLAYVIDNEVAQMIQQHMWEEQMNRELMEATFSVDLVGNSAEGLLKIVNGVQKILDFLNPFSWLKKLVNVTATVDEAIGMEKDIEQMLNAVKVGEGNQMLLTQLTTGNEDLHLVKSYVEQLGGISMYNMAASGRKSWDVLANPLYHMNDSIAGVQMIANAANNSSYYRTNMPTSQYSWGSVSKLQGQLAKSVLTSGIDTLANSIKEIAETATGSATSSAAKQALDKMMDESYIKDEFVKKGKSYDDWIASSSKFGIADVEKAAESVGYAMDDIKKFFEDAEAQAGQEEQHERDLREEAFWQSGMKFWDDYYPNTFAPELHDKLDIIIENQEDWYADFFDAWDTWTKKEYIEPWTAWMGKGKNDTGAWGKWVGDSGAWAKWVGGSKKSPAATWDEFTESVSNFWGFGSKNETFHDLFTKLSDFMAYRSYYGVSSGSSLKSSELLKDLEKIKVDTKKEDRDSAADAMGEVLSKIIIDKDTTDPTLQTNVLLGQILVYVGQIVQQTNGVSGGTSLIDTLSAMSLGLTQTTP